MAWGVKWIVPFWNYPFTSQNKKHGNYPLKSTLTPKGRAVSPRPPNKYMHTAVSAKPPYLFTCLQWVWSQRGNSPQKKPHLIFFRWGLPSSTRNPYNKQNVCGGNEGVKGSKLGAKSGSESRYRGTSWKLGQQRYRPPALC